MSTNRYPPTSRYYGLDTTTYELPGQGEVAYLRRRWVPSGRQFELLQEHTVTQGERLDTIAAGSLGDPEQSWRLCDANDVLDPAELEVPGRVIRITLPEGIPGAPRAD